MSAGETTVKPLIEHDLLRPCVQQSNRLGVKINYHTVIILEKLAIIELNRISME